MVGRVSRCIKTERGKEGESETIRESEIVLALLLQLLQNFIIQLLHVHIWPPPEAKKATSNQTSTLKRIHT